MLLSRRWFLIGSAAAVAAAAAPVAAMADVAVSKGIVAPRFKFRRIHNLQFGLTAPPQIDVPVRLVVGTVSDDRSVLLACINSRASYYWRALDGGEIVVGEDDALKLVCEPAFDGAVITITSNMEPDPKKQARIFFEKFEWSNGKFNSPDGPLALTPEDVDWVPDYRAAA